ncbi:hypothetical protein N7481_010596 [Penicillium waksmanii]|uniref:uncharacterized protein n=1 Tax=Penicillium waksmanii TaxID=69791 RepID=UPI002547A9E5|nr:uncharacterized protein N7481_010596 [Penicillium waksmanii]KAJ5973386.1 hypothetical protein N7481_010596 [Penicillium waksmanii]
MAVTGGIGIFGTAFWIVRGFHALRRYLVAAKKKIRDEENEAVGNLLQEHRLYHRLLAPVLPFPSSPSPLQSDHGDEGDITSGGFLQRAWESVLKSC